MIFHRRQVDIGKTQAGVGVTADDDWLPFALYRTAQGVAAGFGGVVFHTFGVSLNSNISFGKGDGTRKRPLSFTYSIFFQIIDILN
jgi:hypothetical protein